MSHVVLFKLTLPASSVGPLPTAVLKRVLDHLHYFQATAKPTIPLHSKPSPSSYSARTQKSIKATVVLLGDSWTVQGKSRPRSIPYEGTARTQQERTCCLVHLSRMGCLPLREGTSPLAGPRSPVHQGRKPSRPRDNLAARCPFSSFALSSQHRDTRPLWDWQLH